MLANKSKKNIIEYIISFIFLAVAIWGTVIIASKVAGDDIWYDEVFSMVFAGKSVGEMIKLTAADVHPPLYYMYLKAVVTLGTGMFGMSEIVAAKLASILPLFLLDIVSFTYIRKKHGLVSAASAAMMITIMPQLSIYWVEIRMYSFGMLLIGMAYIFGGRIIEDGKHKDYVIFCIIGIMTAYTQYFSCVAIVGLYFYMGIALLRNKRMRDVRLLVISGIVSVLAYVPWIPKFISQVGTVRSNYWIQPMDIKSIPGCIKFFFLPMGGAKGYISAGLGILTVVIVYFLVIRIKESSVADRYYEFAPYSMLILMIVTGYISSILGRPIFVYRYMIPVAAALYFALSFTMGRVANSKNLYMWLLTLPLILIGYYSINSFNIEETNKINSIDASVAAIESLPADGVIIANFDQIAVLMDYYLPGREIYVYEGSVDESAALMYDNDGQALMDSELEAVIEDSDAVYFFGSFNSREELLADFKTRGIDNELVYDSCFIERYYFNIYKLTK